MDLKLKICQIYQNMLEYFGLKYVEWKIDIKKLLEKGMTFSKKS